LTSSGNVRAFLINLDERPDRLRQSTERLARAGITAERISAHTPASARAMGIRPTAPGYAPGNLGCVASHLEVYQRVVDEGIERALVLEDDVLPGVRFRQRLIRSLAELPDDFALFQAGWVDLDPLHRRGVSSLARSVLGTFVPGADHRIAAPFRFGTHAYVVTPFFARHALEHFRSPHLPIDDLITDHSTCAPLRGRCWVSLPSLALQDDSPSNITARREVEGFPTWRRWIA